MSYRYCDGSEVTEPAMHEAHPTRCDVCLVEVAVGSALVIEPTEWGPLLVCNRPECLSLRADDSGEEEAA